MPRIGRTRVGLHYGEAIVGNFGGEAGATYTALGDAMNYAARLEGANKYLKSTALVSDDARKHASPPTFFDQWAGSSFGALDPHRRLGTRAAMLNG